MTDTAIPTRKAPRFNLRDAGTFLGLVLIFAVFAVLNPVFLTAPNLINILQQSSISYEIGRASCRERV